MQYEWDEAKRAANFARHGVDFAVAADFEWDTAIATRDDRLDYGEERWVALGYMANGCMYWFILFVEKQFA
jgi:hypothetical protein